MTSELTTSSADGMAISSKIAGFHLIPFDALVGLATRFDLGVERKGNKAWNALSNNQQCLEDYDWLIERAGHGIQHLYKLIATLRFARDTGCVEFDPSDSDAGAVMFCGAILECALRLAASANRGTNADSTEEQS